MDTSTLLTFDVSLFNDFNGGTTRRYVSHVLIGFILEDLPAERSARRKLSQAFRMLQKHLDPLGYLWDKRCI